MDLSRLLVGKKLITVNDKGTYFGDICRQNSYNEDGIEGGKVRPRRHTF